MDNRPLPLSLGVVDLTPPCPSGVARRAGGPRKPIRDGLGRSAERAR